jgi:hypothetical protein
MKSVKFKLKIEKNGKKKTLAPLHRLIDFEFTKGLEPTLQQNSSPKLCFYDNNYNF